MIKDQSPPQVTEASQKAEELVAEQLSVQASSVGMLGNLLSIAAQRSYTLYLNIIGDYRYRPLNEFSYSQKGKILEYLHTKVTESNGQLQNQEDTRFADFDPSFMKVLPGGLEELRAKVLKGRTNLQAARLALQKLQYSRQHLKVRYLNQQAYEFDHVKHNGVAWGFLLGAIINATLYRRGNTIRKAALFVTFGHAFNLMAHRYNIDRFFDSVYPIFQEEAVKFAQGEREAFAGWRPEGKAQIEE